MALLLIFQMVIAEPPASGLRPGDEVSAWEPVHVAGPHQGTKTCPVCTYLEAPTVVAFVRDSAIARKFIKPLEQLADRHEKGKLKVILVVIDSSTEEVKKLSAASGVRCLMVCQPDPAKKDKQLQAYKINPSQVSTIYLYQDYLVQEVWHGLTEPGKVALAAAKYLPR